MPCKTWLAAVDTTPVSFQKKETGAVWRSEVAERVRLLQRSEERSSSAAVGRYSRVGIHHLLESDRASRRTLIALGENHHASGVALKVLATWAGAVNNSDPCANFYTHSKRRSSLTTKA